MSSFPNASFSNCANLKYPISSIRYSQKYILFRRYKRDKKGQYCDTVRSDNYSKIGYFISPQTASWGMPCQRMCSSGAPTSKENKTAPSPPNVLFPLLDSPKLHDQYVFLIRLKTPQGRRKAGERKLLCSYCTIINKFSMR